MKEFIKTLPDWAVRALKTAVQAFGSVLIPEVVVILNGGWPESWSVFWGCIAPVVSAALAAAICAVWNILLERLKEKQ